MGIPFAIIASPCTTPITATVLAYAAAKGSMWYGFSLLFTYLPMRWAAASRCWLLAPVPLY
ncbi:cytochrome c biogenesis protein CcdA [Desulforamulus putei]|uniref:cytochrome c biogenesis protein CcdA n=1 Tax=Desulforamulus putei TaxID=74701 RepID=UPI003A5BC0CC